MSHQALQRRWPRPRLPWPRFLWDGEPGVLAEEGPGPLASCPPSHQGERTARGGGAPHACLEERQLRVSHVRQERPHELECSLALNRRVPQNKTDHWPLLSPSGETLFIPRCPASSLIPSCSQHPCALLCCTPEAPSLPSGAFFPGRPMTFPLACSPGTGEWTAQPNRPSSAQPHADW